MTKLDQIDAVQAVKDCLEEIRTARLSGGAATAAKAAATADSKAADAERLAAAEAKARGEAGAEQRFEAADKQWRESLSRLERAQLDDEAAVRVIRAAEARLGQIRQTQFDELAEAAEGAVTEVAEAAERLVGPLTEYMAAYAKALATWRPLGPASQQRVLDHDRDIGRYRDIGAVMADASLPDCPLPSNAADLIRAVMPRPRFMRAGYEPQSDDGVVITDVTVTDP